MSTHGRRAFSSAPAAQGLYRAQGQGDAGGHPGNSGGGGGGGGARKKRRRQRPQHSRPRHGGPSPAASPRGEGANRERVLQNIEGLLRQIREAAEEAEAFTQAQLDEFTQSVTALGKLLDSEGEVLSDRAYSEYQRVRDKLGQAVKNLPRGDQEAWRA